MKSVFQSFFAGMGSVLSIFPPVKPVHDQPNALEAIGEDFKAVGNQLRAAMAATAETIAPRQPAAEEHATPTQEQLDLIRA